MDQTDFHPNPRALNVGNCSAVHLNYAQELRVFSLWCCWRSRLGIILSASCSDWNLHGCRLITGALKTSALTVAEADGGLQVCVISNCEQAKLKQTTRL
jgi:hypothetical protein